MQNFNAENIKIKSLRLGLSNQNIVLHAEKVAADQNIVLHAEKVAAKIL